MRRQAATQRLIPQAELVAVIASGPSLAPWQVAHVTAKGAACVATNTSFRALTAPGVVYGCDGPWWDRYHAEVAAAGHEGWTMHEAAARRYNLRHVRAIRRPGLGKVPGVLHHGGNSGYQAINLAFQMGAKLIVLLGFDMQRTGGLSHWHGDHPAGLTNVTGIEGWRKNFGPLAADLKAAGVRCVNCSVETAIDCFERADVRDIL